MLPTECSIAPNARVVAPYAHTLWSAALSGGVSQAQLTQSLGRSQVGDEDVRVSQYLAMLQTACTQLGSGFGWSLGQSVKPTSYGANGILLLACRTLGEALQQVLRFESLVHDLGRSSIAAQGGQRVYSWRNDCASHSAAGALVASVFSGIQTCAQWLVDGVVAPDEIRFVHRLSAEDAALIARASGARVTGGCSANQVVFAAALLETLIPQANAAMLPLLQQHANALLQARHPSGQGIVVQVRKRITGRLGGGQVRLGDVASDLCMSVRTLQRHLAQAGVAYQGVLDDTRHELALHYLASTTMALAAVSDLLACQDTSAFNHAFKQWQGVTPAAYRSEVRSVN